MYLLNAATEIEWVISPTGSPPLLADLDVLVENPIGLSEYYSSAILAPDYVPPDATTPGSASYTYTPTREGLYKIRLVIGTPTSYTVLSTAEIFVFDNTLTVNPAKQSPYGFNGSIEVRDEGIILSSNVTTLDFIGPRVAAVENAGVVQIFLDDFPTVPYQQPADLLTALSGALTESQLYQALNDRIDLIDGIHPGSVNARISVVQGELDILEATVADPLTGLSATSTALDLVETWVEVFDDAITAYSGGTTQFVTQVGANQTTIEVHASSLNGLEAQYTVKVDANGYVSGFGLATTLKDAVPFSEFVIVADQFSIAPVATDPDAIDASPFFHLTVPTLIDGELIPAGTYMKSAWIHNAAIQNAQIGDVIESADGGVSWRIDKTGGISGRSITLRNTAGDLLVDPDGNGQLWQTFGTLVPETPSGAGFYNDATHLGFYDGGAWKTYMDKNGDFYLVGGVNGGLFWDASAETLNITGSISVTNPASVYAELNAGSGINIAPAQFTKFNVDAVLPTMAKSATATLALVDTFAFSALSDKQIRLAASGGDAYVYFGSSVTDYNIPVIGGKKYIFSIYVYLETSNSPLTTNNLMLYVKTDTAVHLPSSLFSIPTAVWTRVSFAIDLAPYTSVRSVILRADNESYTGPGSTYMHFDGAMFEEQIGDLSTASTYVPPYDNTVESLQVGTVISGGGITLDNGGSIKSANKTDYSDTDPGFFLGYDTTETAYVFNIGNANSYLKWSGSFLSVRTGSITSQGIDINPGNDNELHFYGNRGDGTIQEIGSIGINTTVESDTVVISGGSHLTGTSVTGVYGASATGKGVDGYSSGGYGVYGHSFNGHGGFFQSSGGNAALRAYTSGSNSATNAVFGDNQSNNNNVNGVLGQVTSATGVGSHGVRGIAVNGPGVRGTSTSNAGVSGDSTSSFGVYGKSESGYAMYAYGVGTTVKGHIGMPVGNRVSSPTFPNWNAIKGTLYMRDDAILFVNQNGSNTWVIV